MAFGYSTALVFQHSRPIDFGPSTARKGGKDALRALLNGLNAGGGSAGGTPAWHILPSSAGYARCALGIISFGSASGVVGATINGVSITVTAAGGDPATAILLRDAINASSNALVNKLVRATCYIGNVQCVGAVAGDWVSIANWRFEAVSGAPQTEGQFQIGANNNATASNLFYAIESHSGACDLFRPTLATNNVGISWISEDAPPTSPNILSSSQAVRLIPTQIANYNYTNIYSVWPGAIGNCITLAATGTGCADLTGARLILGAGGEVSQIFSLD